MKLFKDILTEDDNQTYCAARLCAVTALFGFLGIALLHVLHGVKQSPRNQKEQ